MPMRMYPCGTDECTSCSLLHFSNQLANHPVLDATVLRGRSLKHLKAVTDAMLVYLLA